jgi:hypothetical protein
MASVVISGDTSGSVTITAPAVAGTPTLTLPTTTDTLVGKATTDTLTNKTLVAPALGTPSSLVLTNATGLPQAGLGTNVVGNGPVFWACASGSQALTQNTWNKILFGTEIFDTNNNFASSRFTPTVAGYYQFSANINFGAGANVTDSRVSLYKNGSLYVSGTAISATNSNGTPFTGLGYANGSTDYFEIYAYTGTASTTTYGDGGGPYTTFQGVLVRSA